MALWCVGYQRRGGKKGGIPYQGLVNPRGYEITAAGTVLGQVANAAYGSLYRGMQYNQVNGFAGTSRTTHRSCANTFL
jgi:hypothetical protein